MTASILCLEMFTACRGMLRAFTTFRVLIIAYYVAFGPHGPRTPVSPPGTVMKTLLGTLGLLAISGILFSVIHSQGMLQAILIPLYHI